MPLSQDDVQKYKKLYLETARNYLVNMQTCVSELLNNDHKPETVKQIHLDAHSLKSQSQMMGYQNVAKITSIIEELFNKEEKENIVVSKPILTKIQSDV